MINQCLLVACSHSRICVWALSKFVKAEHQTTVLCFRFTLPSLPLCVVCLAIPYTLSCSLLLYARVLMHVYSCVIWHTVKGKWICLSMDVVYRLLATAIMYKDMRSGGKGYTWYYIPPVCINILMLALILNLQLVVSATIIITGHPKILGKF